MYKYNRNSAYAQKKIYAHLLYTRNKLIYQYRNVEKMSYDKIGIIFGITRERVRQILDEYQKSLDTIDNKSKI